MVIEYNWIDDDTGRQMLLGEGEAEHLPAAALRAARRGDAARADDAELEFIRRTQFGIELKDGRVAIGVPRRLVRGHGEAGRLAVEWCTIDGTFHYTDIDGKEL